MAAEAPAAIEVLAPLVFDTGSSQYKVGLSGEDSPRSSFICIVGREGRPPHNTSVFGMGQHTATVGERHLGSKGIRRSYFPVKEGIIDWEFDNIIHLWSHAFEKELRVDPSQHPLLMTENALNPRSTREKTLQVMMESFQVPALYLATRAAMSLYASGAPTGLVVQSGDAVSHCIPVFEGFALKHALRTFATSGSDITSYLYTAHRDAFWGHPIDEGNPMLSIYALQRARECKQRICYTPLDYSIEKKKDVRLIEKEFELPAGDTIRLELERINATEGLFQPEIIGKQGVGMHHAIAASIAACDPDLHSRLWGCVLLSGGNTAFEGLAQRLEKELTLLAPADTKVRVVAPPQRQYSSWLGGSLFASAPTFLDLCISKAEYDECGASVVHRRCFQ